MSNHPPSGAHGADAGGSLPELSAHKRAVQRHFDRLAPEMERWRRKSWYYHQELRRFCRDTIPSGQSVLEVGCGTGGCWPPSTPGRASASISAREWWSEPARSSRISRGSSRTPRPLDLGRQFDYVILSDLLGHLEDIWRAFRRLQSVWWARGRCRGWRLPSARRTSAPSRAR